MQYIVSEYEVAYENAVKFFDNTPDYKTLDLREIANKLFIAYKENIEMYNATVSDKRNKLKVPLEITPELLAVAFYKKYDTAYLNFKDRKLQEYNDDKKEKRDVDKSRLILYYYDDDKSSSTYGLYNPNILSVVESVLFCITKDINTFISTFLKKLSMLSPIKDVILYEDLIATRNGIFDYKTKKLIPFSKDYIFVNKTSVNYNEDATNVIIHNDEDNSDWDVDSWFDSLSDDKDIVNLLWQVVGASIRPYVNWNKTAFFYSTKGNNGKGTLCRLITNLANNFASIPIADFSLDFKLETILGTNLVIADENDVNGYIDSVSRFKAVITGDTININRKFEKTVDYRFNGFVIQCLNGLPKIKDKSPSFLRRIMMIPFDKSFEGIDKTYIKNEYLGRIDVLEYVLFKILNMNHYSFDIPERCSALLDDFNRTNDNIYDFFCEFESEFVWDVIPYKFLHDLYKAWLADDTPQHKAVGLNLFNQQLESIINDKFSNKWKSNRNIKLRVTANQNMESELLIDRYKLEKYYSQSKSKDVYAKCKFNIDYPFRGISRV